MGECVVVSGRVAGCHHLVKQCAPFHVASTPVYIVLSWLHICYLGVSATKLALQNLTLTLRKFTLIELHMGVTIVP